MKLYEITYELLETHHLRIRAKNKKEATAWAKAHGREHIFTTCRRPDEVTKPDLYGGEMNESGDPVDVDLS
jgi:hypothetical protein